MSTHNKLDKICVVIVAVSLLLTVLFMNGESLGITMIVDEDAESYSGTTYFTTNDQNSDWDTEGATVITLTGDSAEITGNGAYVNGQEVVITEAGRYVVSGSLSDGKITVDAHNSSKVWILLDGVDINCSDDACIRVDQAEKVFLTLAENSVNTLTSGSTYSDTALQDGTDGAIFAHDDLTINGSGSLSVTAEYRHGIAANDDLVITGGTITIKAAADAIHANDSVCVKEAQITVDAGDDGIVTANEEENGYMYIESGTIDITSVGDGIHTTGDITIAGGSITIAAGDDGIHSDQFVYIEDGEILINECYEGIEALIIDVSGGDITVYPEDDGFNANGGSSDMFGFGGGPGQGGMQGSSKEEGLGQDTMQGSSKEEGLEQDGSDPVDMSSNGDSNGQMEQTTEEQPPSIDVEEEKSTETAAEEIKSSEMPAEEEETYISISGGTITIINDSGRDADGLDSNEDIRISGGTIYISLLGTGSNCAVDYGSESGGVAEITGGTIIACGASSMAEGFSSTSTQASILYNTSTVADEGTTLALEDEEGNILLSWDVPCSFSSALISCPEMQVGNSYQVVIGDSAEEITLEEISTSYGDAQSGMTGGDMGGGMQHGGDIQPGGGFEGWPFSDTTEGTASEDSTTEGSTAEDSTENAQGDMPAMPEGMQKGHGGPGGHGGRGNGQTPPDMSQDGATEMQTPPDMNQDGTTEGQTPTDMSQDSTTESQTPPDMSQDGTTESQTPPDMSQDGTTEGQAQPEMHDGQTGGPMMGEQGQQETSQEAEDQAEEQTVTAQTVDAKTLTIYGGCAALLIAAIAVSMMYKRH